MSTSETLLQATINRITARIGQGLINQAAEISVLAKDAPEKLKKELELFQEEIIKAADRLEKEDHEVINEKKSDYTSVSRTSECSDAQQKIDQLREKILILNRNIEERN